MIYDMIYDIWYKIYDTGYDIWYMIHDTWYMIYDIWYMKGAGHDKEAMEWKRGGMWDKWRDDAQLLRSLQNK